MIRSGEHAIWDARMSNIRMAVIVASFAPMTEVMRKMENALRITVNVKMEAWATAMKKIGEELRRLEAGGSAVTAPGSGTRRGGSGTGKTTSPPASGGSGTA